MEAESGEKGMRKRRRMIEDQAKEELELLESLHPNRFHYLKHELNSFIDHLQSSHNVIINTNDHLQYSTSPSEMELPPSFTTFSTQESTSCKRRRKKQAMDIISPPEDLGLRSNCNRIPKTRSSRIDVVLERAHVCLQKIQLFKSQLFPTPS